MENRVTNVVIAGLGGQGVLTASNIVAMAAFLSGCDVKKSEVHGMSQRGGSVCSDVRFGQKVYSPMVPPGEADFLLVLSPDQIDVNRWRLKSDGVLIEPSMIDINQLGSTKTLNIALLGLLSKHIHIPEKFWENAIEICLKGKNLQLNLSAFQLGRNICCRI